MTAPARPAPRGDARASAHAWVEVDAAALAANLAAFRARVGPDVRICPVVKANAYGHGLAPCARLAAGQGADALAVATVAEGLRVRAAGVRLPVVILGWIPTDPDTLAVVARERLEPTVFEPDAVAAIDAAGRRARRRIPVHLKLETGTHRYGFLAAELPALARQLAGARGIAVAGASTHFANIEDTTTHGYARRQLAEFRRLVRVLGRGGVQPAVRHIASSAATILFEATHFDMVRVGIAFYGLWPSRETLVSSRHRRAAALPLRPALTWKTRVAQLKELPAGACIGYGCTYKTTRPTRLAVLPLGYWDGYDRSLSGQAHVLVRGRRAPVRGRVCMNVFMVDVSDVPGAAAGDEVVLLGTQGDETISAEELAGLAGTIAYEMVTRINPDLPRVLV